MKKVLTISIAAYNVEKFIEKTLNSLIIENLDKLEIIVVNDGSKDKTQDIIEEYRRKYPKSIRVINKENGGYGSTINTSIKLATGKYFKQLDGDDWYSSQNLELLLKKLEKISVDIVYSPMITVYTDSGKEETFQEISDKKEEILRLEEIIEEISKNRHLSMHSLAYKTSLLKENNIECLEKCFYTDTEYAIYPFLFSKSIFLFKKPIYYYRVGREGQSVSIEGLRKNYKDIIRVLNNIIIKYLKKEKDLNFEVKKYYNKVIINVINFLLTALIVLLTNRESFKIVNEEIEKLKKNYEILYYKALKEKRFLSKILYSNFSKNYLYYKILKFIFDKKNKIKN